eukprot:5653679-Prymnesium_polylepis.2
MGHCNPLVGHCIGQPRAHGPRCNRLTAFDAMPLFTRLERRWERELARSSSSRPVRGVVDGKHCASPHSTMCDSHNKAHEHTHLRPH